MDETNSLATVDPTALATLSVTRAPEIVLAEAQKAAKALQGVIAQKANPVLINGQQYLEFEDWQTVGRFYSVTAKVTSVRYVEYGAAHGFEAAAVAINVNTGMELTAAESMCLDNESRWTDRELFQIKSMAQTRACAKALRNVLSWVVVLAGYAPTPAEEMTGTETSSRQARQQVETPKPRPDGVTTVASVKRVTKEGKNWVRFDVTFADGRKAATFDKHLGEQAERLQTAGTQVRVVDGEHIQRGERGTDLIALEEVAVASQRVTDEELATPDPQVVETILTVRTVQPPGGAPWWVIQGSEREYVTAVEAVKDTAERLRVSKAKVYVVADKKRGRLGGLVRQVTEFTDAGLFDESATNTSA